MGQKFFVIASENILVTMFIKLPHNWIQLLTKTSWWVLLSSFMLTIQAMNFRMILEIARNIQVRCITCWYAPAAITCQVTAGYPVWIFALNFDLTTQNACHCEWSIMHWVCNLSSHIGKMPRQTYKAVAQIILWQTAIFEYNGLYLDPWHLTNPFHLRQNFSF